MPMSSGLTVDIEGGFTSAVFDGGSPTAEGHLTTVAHQRHAPPSGATGLHEAGVPAQKGRPVIPEATDTGRVTSGTKNGLRAS